MISDSNPNPFANETGCGRHLREAREAAGLTLDEAATRLHVPSQVVRSLEQEDWQRLGAPVFVRGQLRSYARLLGIDLAPLLQEAHIAPIEPVELVSHTHTPRLRRIMESAARKAMYVVITGVFAVPVWYATRTHFDANSPSTASLDVVPNAASPDPSMPAPQGSEPGSSPQAAQDNAPYIASIAPLPMSSAPQGTPVPAAQGALLLRFNGDSWVQISAPDGSSIEKALIKSGEQRSYPSGQVGRVVLGNAAAVEVQQAGSIVDLKPYQRANVARFTVSSDGAVVPASE